MLPQAHRPAVPGDLAHVGQGALQKTAACGQRQQAHAGGDPLLRLAALAHRHEEFNRPVHAGAPVGAGHRQERDHDVQRLVAFLGPVLQLFGHRRQRALGTAFDDAAHRVGACRRRRDGRRLMGLQHRAQDGVGPVGGQAFQARVPGLPVQVLEVLVRIVDGDVDGLGNRRVDQRLHRLHHRDVAGRRHLQRAHEVGRQICGVAAERAIQPPGMVFDLVLRHAVVRLALVAPVGPGERGFDAIGGVVCKGQADRAGRRDRQQVAVANAVLADRLAQFGRQPAGKGARCQVAVRFEARKRAFFASQRDRGGIGGVA